MSIEVGVVGLGYWGPNVARNLNAIEGSRLAWCCESDPARRERWSTVFPTARFTDRLDEMLADEALDAVAITAPVSDHARFAARVLDAGKHCFVEKPLAHSMSEAADLVRKADERGLVLMVGHLLEYHPAVEALEAELRSGELGDLVYIYSNRLNLGKLREDENALWDLGTHDLSVILRLAGMPDQASAHGHREVREGVEDVVFAHLKFASGPTAHMHVSWLDPHKERRITVVGSRRMAVFDDMTLEGKLTIYDKGFDPDEASVGDYVARSGAITSPPISEKEPLRIECEHWVECIAEGRTPRSDGHSGLRVVRVLEALQASLASGGEGRPVPADPLAVEGAVG
ncbi:MAG: Gfo/Idh/MocA family protein [Solirubrobacterales bacterium]